MAGLNETASGGRVHIAFFGRRNAGKSSVVNAVTGQPLSIVSDVKGTTTDPVQKSMELLPLGPVVIIDTPGIDDEGNEIVETIECTVTVKEIQKKVAPVIDDAWVAKFMPMYKDVAAMRDDIRRGLNRQLSGEYENYKRNMAAGELAKRFKGSIADEVYESMSRNLMNNMRAEVEQQNMTWDQFVEQQGGEQQFNMMMMMQTRQMLVQGYALDALFRHEGLVVSDEDVQEACAAMNPQNPQGVRRQMEESGRGFALREAAERIKANKWLLEHADITVKDPNETPAAE